MRRYSIAKISGDFYGLGSSLTGLVTIKARNYDDAIDKAVEKLRLKPGDTLSIIALQGKMPNNRGLLPSRWEYEIS